jgi:hypothetical protein
MMRFLKRLFAGAAPENNIELLSSGGYRQRGVAIENQNREPPLAGITQIATADAIAQIFDSDAKRQEAQSSRSSAHGGAISFNQRRK